MRRFIKTVTVRRHVQFTVIQDGTKRTFTVQRWAAEDDATEAIATYDYPAGDLDAQERIRGAAIAEAARLADAEQRGRDAMQNPAEVWR